MCTLTWLTDADSYQVFFNRDELNSRLPAIPPGIYEKQKVKYISPIDRDAGGTWVSVNEYGTTICLLNYYSAEKDPALTSYESRGQLVKTLCHFDYRTNLHKLQSLNLKKFNSFKILILSPATNGILFTWDGNQLSQLENPKAPVCSSSFNSDDVLNNRITQFQQLHNPTTKDLIDYHASHQPQRSAYSVCMHRDNAQTVSFSHITVDSRTICFAYANGAPCHAELEKPVTMAVRQQEASTLP